MDFDLTLSVYWPLLIVPVMFIVYVFGCGYYQIRGVDRRRA